MSNNQSCKSCPPPGAPLWLATFADLMSLLMCFFVLILSFSNMDIVKYKKALGSLNEAFGVQRLRDEAPMIPKGTSVIADYFSPGKPTHTVLEEIRQETTDDTRQNLEFHETPAEQTKKRAFEVAELMVDEIKEGKVEIEYNPHKILIRINNKSSFAAGSDTLQYDMIPVLDKIRMTLAEIPGEITISGHTDDVPVFTKKFESNWELSAARAAAVAKVLFKNQELDRERFTVDGHADTRPLVPNTSKENREKNRRVEIWVAQPKPGEKTPEAMSTIELGKDIRAIPGKLKQELLKEGKKHG